MNAIPSHYRTALLSRYNSRQNKIWLATGGSHFHGLHIEYHWTGAPYRSRLQFQFEPDGEWVRAESYEDDIAPTLAFDEKRKV